MQVNYHKILGISESATREQIKKAYRQKAKVLHPDRNTSPNAHEQFILLTEAYEYLINQGSGKTSARAKVNYEDWHMRGREEARQRAREHAWMRYEEYKKSDFYKKTRAAFVIWDHFYLLSSVLVLVGSPSIGFLTSGWAGLWGGLAFVVLTTPYWGGIFFEKHEINFSSLWLAMVVIGKTRLFQSILLTVFNLFILFRFTLNTEISTYIFWSIAALLVTLSYFVSPYIAARIPFISRAFFVLCIMPYIFNLFFMFNYVFSSSPVTETYSFYRMDNSGHIYLKNKEYENNDWFRVFFSYDSVRNADKITYTFEKGLFGIRVLKNYEFN